MDGRPRVQVWACHQVGLFLARWDKMRRLPARTTGPRSRSQLAVRLAALSAHQLPILTRISQRICTRPCTTALDALSHCLPDTLLGCGSCMCLLLQVEAVAPFWLVDHTLKHSTSHKWEALPILQLCKPAMANSQYQRV